MPRHDFQIPVTFKHRVCFTRDAFGPGNALLGEILAEGGGRRVLVAVEESGAAAWPELARAREESLTQIVLRHAPDRTHVINAAAPVGLDGDTLLLTRNPVDITQSVRAARSIVAVAVLMAIYGLAVFGYITASFATFFIGQEAEAPEGDVVGPRDIAELRADIAALREDLLQSAALNLTQRAKGS